MVLTDGKTSITLDEGDFRLERVSYLAPKIKNTLAPLEGGKESLFIGGKTGAREVKIEGYISGNTEENRKALLHLCDKSPITLVDGEYSLEIVLDSAVSMSSEKRFRDKLLKYEITAIAPSPYWQGEKISKTFYGCSGTSKDENAIFISNVGELSVGCEIRVYLMTGCNSFTLTKDSKGFKYNSAVSTLDAVYIDTRVGKKSVTLQRNGSSERVSAIDKVMPGSSFFTLAPGENRIDFAIPLGVAYISIDYTPLYLR